MLIDTDAIVLRTVNYSDTSIIAILLSKNYGKITVMAKGARKFKSPFSAQLEPMNILSLNYFHKDGRNIQLLKESSFIENSSCIRQDINSLSYGLTVVEILDKLIHENDIDPIIFRLGVKVLLALKKNDINNDILFSFFVLQLSIRLGFMPEFKKCFKCSIQLQSANFDQNEGELICENCSIDSTISFSLEAIELLKLLLNTNIKNLGTIELNKKTINYLNSFIDYYSRYHLEGMTKVKSLKILRKLVDG